MWARTECRPVPPMRRALVEVLLLDTVGNASAMPVLWEQDHVAVGVRLGF
jgi:hypothetical protein